MDVSVLTRCIKDAYPANSFTLQAILFTGNLSLAAGCTFYREVLTISAACGSGNSNSGSQACAKMLYPQCHLPSPSFKTKISLDVVARAYNPRRWEAAKDYE